MKLMKRALALLLCFLMLTNGPISAFATEGTDDVVVETTTTTETVETCEECGGSDAHAETCSLNIVAPLTTETPDETTEPTTTPTQDSTTPSTVVTEPTVTTGPAISTDPVGCTECNQTEDHLESCSQYVSPTEETTEPTVSGNDVVACTECGATEGHTTECSQYVAPVTKCEHCGIELTEGAVHLDTCLTFCTCEPVEGVHQEGCKFYKAPAEVNVFEDLMAAESVEAMYAQILDIINGDDADRREALMILTYDELEELRARVNELDPEGDDTDTADMLDMLSALPNAECPDCGLIGEHEEDCPRGQIMILPTSTTISSNQTWEGGGTLNQETVYTMQNGAIVTMKNPITIASGATLTIEGHGGFARDASNTIHLFIVQEGGKLILNGTNGQYVVIDGKNVIATAPLISSNGTVETNYAKIQNGKNRASNAAGGGIVINKTGTLTMDNSFVTANTASVNGGGIMCYGDFTIKNTEITLNRAAAAETNEPKVNHGRGGGVYLSGEGAEGTLENVKITNNAAMYYGGGVQVASYAKLTMNAGTVINDNEAILHGAGGVHLTANAIFIMNGGEISNNKAQTVGGAIHSSHGCTLELNAGEIKGNIANGRGGGVHLNTGCSITLEDKITISGNKVYNKPTGTHADLDETGDNWSNVRYEGPCDNNGYGGGVMIDAGTCTVKGATITDNYAEVGGGGIALVMINVSNDNALRDLRVVNFTMTSGTVSGNKTSGNGAGVYMMSNKIKEGIIEKYGKEGTDEYEAAVGLLNDSSYLTQIPQAVVSGGTINNNTANENGGGLYLDKNTEFHISGTGDISTNKAVDGAGVYIAKGTAYVEGGTIQGNVAKDEGGGIYVSGSVNMTGGSIANNYAVNGGGAYLTGGDFTMISGSIKNNAVKNDNQSAAEAGTEGYGGGVFVHNGDITIGVENCAGSGTNHTTGEHTDKAHPEVIDNDAMFGGGLAVDGGTVDIHCGKIITNTAMNNGAGTNIFMYDSSGEDEGEINHNGGTIGEDTNHGMVVIGGNLNVNIGGTQIRIKYHSNENDYITLWIGNAPKDYYLNLPYCPQDWENAQNPEFTFAGWTYDSNAADQPGTIIDLDHIRDKNDYKALGEPVQIKEITGNKDAEGLYVDFYAVWAPKNNSVSYDIDFDNFGSVVDVFGQAMTAEQQAGNTTGYEFSYQKNATITMTNPSIPGYTFLGWRVTPSEEFISNWSIKEDNEGVNDESVEYLLASTTSGTANLADYGYAYSADGSTFTLSTDRNFGNIKLTALFEEQTAEYTYILVGPEKATNFGTLTATGASENYLPVTENKQYTVTIGKVTGNPGTATAKAEYGFKLKDPNGWFTDETGTTAVDSACVSEGTLTPAKVNNLYEGGTFYAVIEYHLADLIISKTATGSHSGDQTFIFEVYKGDTLLTTVALQAGESVTIKDLIIGTTYTVKEVGGWSWRFDAKEKNHTMVPVAEGAKNTNEVPFTNTQLKNLWLSDEDVILNKRKSN